MEGLLCRGRHRNDLCLPKVQHAYQSSSFDQSKYQFVAFTFPLSWSCLALTDWHFKCFQVVWKSTKRIGAAYATRKDGSFVVVIRYSPPGNYIGENQFRNNVLPAKGGDGSVMSSLSPRGENGGKRGCSSDISSLIIFAVITIRLFV